MPDESAPKRSRRGSEERQRDKQTLVRWRAEEFQEVDAIAHAAQLTLPSWLRELALDKAKRTTRSTKRAPADRELLAKILGQLGKIGSNLNQLAHAAHLEKLQEYELRATVLQLRATLPLLLEALGRKA